MTSELLATKHPIETVIHETGGFNEANNLNLVRFFTWIPLLVMCLEHLRKGVSLT